jgi:hypothetical protein
MVIVLGVILSILILNIKMAEDLRLEIMNKTMEQAIESVIRVAICSLKHKYL